MRRAVDQSYLLRLWADHADDPLRATLVPVGRQDLRYHFASLDELLDFLADTAEPSPPTAAGDGAENGTTTP